MDVILKVLEGAKGGSRVAVKKDRFLIGRSPKCHLSAASTAISRQHCAIMRHDAKVTVKDLGSRNGTFVNDTKLTEEVELTSGDELAVGPLKFLVTITPGISSTKKAHVKSVADAVERTVEKNDSGVQDDDISGWLLEPGADVKSVTETQTIHMDDTNAAQMQRIAEGFADDETAADVSAHSEVAEEAVLEEELSDGEAENTEKKKKKEPGKLPPASSQPATKDSREAAAEALRAWNRRR